MQIVYDTTCQALARSPAWLPLLSASFLCPILLCFDDTDHLLVCIILFPLIPREKEVIEGSPNGQGGSATTQPHQQLEGEN